MEQTNGLCALVLVLSIPILAIIFVINERKISDWWHDLTHGKQPEKQKRNFDNVSWKWTETINGREVNPFHIFSFANGLAILVNKHAIQTWDGMMWTIIDDFTPEGQYRRVEGKEFGYTHGEGVGEQEILELKERIRRIKYK